jgi:hypothetical protein
MLIPIESLDAPAFLPAGAAVTHTRATEHGRVIHRTEYSYALVPRESGTARLAPFVVRYHNGLTGREEELTVPGTTLSVAPAAVPLFERAGARGVLAAGGAAGLGLAAAALLARFRAKRRRPGDRGAPARAVPEAGTPVSPEAAALGALRARCDAADSGVWIRDAERLCVSWLCPRLGITHPENVRFEAVLDQYLARAPGLAPAAADGWTTLRDLFHEARYGGGRREPHELREACRALKTCLLIDGPQEG